MPPFRYTDAHAQALAEAKGVFMMKVMIQARRADGQQLDLVRADGTRALFPGDQSSTTDDPAVFASTRAVVTGVTKSPPPDCLRVRARSTPIVATRRVADGLASLGVRSLVTIPADIEHASPTPPRKPWPEYTVLVPRAVATEVRVLDEGATPFHTRAIVRHRGETPGVFAVPLNGAVGAFFFCDRSVVELAFEQNWTGVAFTRSGLPDGQLDEERFVHRRPDGSFVWRPPVPTELSPAEWIGYAIEHTDDAPAVLRGSVRLALIHHANAMLDEVTARLRDEIDPTARRVLASLIGEGVRRHRLGWLDAPPSDEAVALADAVRRELS
jgi:hypothetical protein